MARSLDGCTARWKRQSGAVTTDAQVADDDEVVVIVGINGDDGESLWIRANKDGVAEVRRNGSQGRIVYQTVLSALKPELPKSRGRCSRISGKQEVRRRPI